MASAGGIWFTYVQAFEIGKFCPYCLVTHGCGLLISVFLGCGVWRFLGQSPSGPDAAISNRGWLIGLVTIGCLAVTCMVLGQHFFPHDTFVVEELAGDFTTTQAGIEVDGADDDSTLIAAPDTEPAMAAATPDDNSTDDSARFDSDLAEDDLAAIGPARVVVEKPILTGRRNYFFYFRADPINVYEYPILGNPDAQHLLVEVVDYTCHHCREMYHHIEAAREHFGDQLAIVVRPVALDQSCNPYVQRQLPAHDNACKYVRASVGRLVSFSGQVPRVPPLVDGAGEPTGVANRIVVCGGADWRGNTEGGRQGYGSHGDAWRKSCALEQNWGKSAATVRGQTFDSRDAARRRKFYQHVVRAVSIGPMTVVDPTSAASKVGL